MLIFLGPFCNSWVQRDEQRWLWHSSRNTRLPIKVRKGHLHFFIVKNNHGSGFNESSDFFDHLADHWRLAWLESLLWRLFRGECNLPQSAWRLQFPTTFGPFGGNWHYQRGGRNFQGGCSGVRDSIWCCTPWGEIEMCPINYQTWRP